MRSVMSYVTLVNEKYGDMVYIMPRCQQFGGVAAIAGISVKNIAGELVVDTGSWLGDMKVFDKEWNYGYDYSFLIPITEEEFYSNNFDYPVPEVG